MPTLTICGNPAEKNAKEYANLPWELPLSAEKNAEKNWEKNWRERCS